MSFDVTYMINAIPRILKSFPTTLYMTLCSMAAGLALGLVMQSIVTSRAVCLKWPRTFIRGFVVVIRSIPIIIQLLIFYFAFPRYLGFMKDWEKTTYVIVCFAIIIGVSSCETFRSAREAVGKGQFEAATSIGYTEFQSWLHIIFPQMAYIAFPNLANLLIMMLRDTSLAFALGVTDMMGYAKILDANTYGMKRTEIYLAVVVIYWAITVILEKVFAWIERRMSRGSSSVGAGQKNG